MASLYTILIAFELCFRELKWVGYIHDLGILTGMSYAIGMTSHAIEKTGGE